MGHIGAQELLIIALIFIVIFGARKLPETAKGIAQSLRVFKKELRDEDKPAVQPALAADQGVGPESTPAASTVTPSQPAAVVADTSGLATPTSSN